MDNNLHSASPRRWVAVWAALAVSGLTVLPAYARPTSLNGSTGVTNHSCPRGRSNAPFVCLDDTGGRRFTAFV